MNLLARNELLLDAAASADRADLTLANVHQKDPGHCEDETHRDTTTVKGSGQYLYC
jgi:hypothetical protein